MKKMDEQTQAILDFPKIIGALEDLCLSEEGRDLLGRQEFFLERGALDRHMIRVCEFRMLLEGGEGIPAFDFPPLFFLKRIALEGTVLEGAELAGLGRFIRSSASMAEFLRRKPENRDDYTGVLRGEAEILPDLKGLAEEISSHLDSSGEVLENHPALRPIRRAIDQINKDINTLAYSFLREDRDIWQADVPTLRDGRMVLPLKADFRGSVKGIVHEVSGRGATLFIEPLEIVEKNNRLALEENRLRMEIHRILRELTAAVRGRLDECRRMWEQIAYLDTLYARARYAQRHECSRPQIQGRGFRLLQAVHPGLGQMAVPIDIELPEDANQLIITGPNTGGKTVSLKTVGLFVLMHQFGMEIPVRQGSALALMSGVYADVGDGQSIENSLSTFSGHMKRLSFIMEKSDDQSLVLLDELGGGTDPHEGAAMAMAILDWFGPRNTMMVVTTHLGVMKNYGYTRGGCLNASVSFDEVSLRPTYHILQGIPGGSHALEIAAATGVDGDLVKTAASYLAGEESDVAAMIEELRKTQDRLGKAEANLEKARRGVEEERRQVELKALRLRQREREIREGQYGELRHYVRESRRALENLVADLKTGSVTKEKTRRVKTFISGLTHTEETAQAALEEDRTAPEPMAVPEGFVFREGMEILFGPLKRPGILVRRDKKERWLVMVGNLKMSLSEGELVPAKPEPPKVSVVHPAGGSQSAVLELDLRGMRLEEALRALDRQINDALMAGLSRFSIIHGLGEGVLQRGVHDCLQGCAAVEKFEFAHLENGGHGKTEITLSKEPK